MAPTEIEGTRGRPLDLPAVLLDLLVLMAWISPVCLVYGRPSGKGKGVGVKFEA